MKVFSVAILIYLDYKVKLSFFSSNFCSVSFLVFFFSFSNSHNFCSVCVGSPEKREVD